MLLELNLEVLDHISENTQVALVSIQEDGSMIIPLHNFQGFPVNFHAGLGLGWLIWDGGVLNCDGGVLNCDGGALDCDGL